MACIRVTISKYREIGLSYFLFYYYDAFLGLDAVWKENYPYA